MAMLDSLFSKGFKASKCKTMLKLTIPRIKLLRNRREIQIKQMRRDIAKLLETGQEATARIRVEHIIREEKMMAAQEILELFCELIAVRLPIIEMQRECPLDLKEAISSVCFAAPRCADLPELLQVQLLFTSKYGKEFVAAATELMPDCGVNRQLIELLSIRAPSPEKKLTLLKEIAEEHKVDWDPAVSETELFKSHEDLLFVSGSKLPLPKEKHDETLDTCPDEALLEKSILEKSESDMDMDILDLPNVPMKSVVGACAPDIATAPVVPPIPATTELEKKIDTPENVSQDSSFKVEETSLERFDSKYEELKNISAGTMEDKQFLPFIAPPLPILPTSLYAKPIEPPSEPPRSILRTTSEVNVDLQDVLAAAPSPILPTSLYAKPIEPPSEPPRSILRTTSEVNVDFQDVLAAAQNAAESAEQAAAAARAAASLAQIRISEITKKKNEQVPDAGSENPFHKDMPNQGDSKELSDIGEHSLLGNVGVESPRDENITLESEGLNVSSSESIEVNVGHDSVHYTPQILPSMEDDTYFSYPNLFTLQNSNEESGSHNLTGHST